MQTGRTRRASVGTRMGLNQARQAPSMSWNPLTFSSRKLHLSCDLLLHSCIAAAQSIVYLATANLLCLNSISFSPAILFPLNGNPIDYQNPISLFAGLEPAKKLKGPKPSQNESFGRKPKHLGKSYYAPLGRRSQSTMKPQCER